MLTAEHFDRLGAGQLPGHLCIVITQVGDAELRSALPIRPVLMTAVPTSSTQHRRQR